MKTLFYVCMAALVVGGAKASSLVRVKQCLREEAVKMTPLLLQKAYRYEKGFVTNLAGEAVCDNGADASGKRGVTWELPLNQQKPVPVMISAEALAEDAPAGESPDFSIYTDVQFTDGTFLWGQIASFSPEEKGWQRRSVIIIPPRPIRTISAHLLYRNLPGRVRFRNAQYGIDTRMSVQSFDRVNVMSLGTQKEGFLLRDVAAKGDFYRIPPELYGRAVDGFPALSASRTEGKNGTSFFEASLESDGKRDRALTLYYVFPVAAERWFGSGAQVVEKSNMESPLMDITVQNTGANGGLSRYPFAALERGGKGIGIGIDPFVPAYYRIAYYPQQGEFILALDVGLAPESPRAKFRFCMFSFDPANGFRGALEAYHKIYPEAFRRRIAKQGLWMPFAPISKVQGFEDFGFRFKEGIDETAWDDAHDVLSFRYTEPMTWWMPIPTNLPYSLPQAKAIAEKRFAEGDPIAKAWKTSVFHSRKGSCVGWMRYTPWCNGIVWSMNVAPGIQGEVTDFSTKWNEKYIEKTYGASVKGGCDGEYIDSAEAYVTETLDFRRDHFSAMRTPLCYCQRTHKVGIYKGMICFEYIRAMADGVHRRGRYMMANATPDAWFWLAPQLDVMGTEINWKYGEKWHPMSLDSMFYRRALCGGKPYCYLMNTDFTKWTYDDSERYMKRSLAFGFFPGFFSADASTKQYFANPSLYNRDRPLFKKYIPVIRRVAEAGWEPVTGVKGDVADIQIERFGKPGSVCCVTVFNGGKKTQRVTLLQSLFAGKFFARDLVSGERVDWPASGLSLTLPTEDVRVFEFFTK